MPHETAAVSAQVLCTPYNHAPCHFMQSHVCKVYACLAVTCHRHFWQHDRDLLRATAVTQGWNGYRNKSQHRKSTLEKKILPPLLQGFEPATFQSWVRCSNHWAIPAPRVPLFYWLEKACSAYPRLTGLTFLLNIMWKGQLRDSPRLVWFDFSINNSTVYPIFHYPQTWKIP